MWSDPQYGFRALRRSPALTTAAVFSLALGIGANTAIFSLLDQVVLRSLPVADPERLVALHGNYSGPGQSSSAWSINSESVFPYPFYKQLRGRDPAFSGMIACALAPVRIGWRSDTQAAQAEMVSGNYFTTLGVPTVLGRPIVPDDDGSPASAIDENGRRLAPHQAGEVLPRPSPAGGRKARYVAGCGVILRSGTFIAAEMSDPSRCGDGRAPILRKSMVN